MASWKWVEADDHLSWRRTDGATVRWYNGPLKMHWIAYEPDPSEDYLIRRSKNGNGWPRVWKSAQAARRAVDAEFPVIADGGK